MKLITEDYWSNTTFNGSSVNVGFKSCDNEDQPYNDYITLHEVSLTLSFDAL